MRTTLVLGLLLMLIAAPAAQAQQATAPARDARSALPVIEAPLTAQPMDTARVTTGVVQLQEDADEVAARREVSARNLLAIVGGAVIVIALIVLLR